MPDAAFHHASDAKLLKVTRLIDDLPERGAADALLEPVRHRLAALRPVRRINRTRLLFTPFDSILVPAGRWRPGALALPRSLLTPLLDLLALAGADALPPQPPFDADDEWLIDRNGRPLWAAAADILAQSVIPPGWAEPGRQMQSGVSMAMLQQMVPVAAMVFRHGLALRTLPAPHEPEYDSALTSLLHDAARHGPLAWGIMLMLLFDRAPADRLVRLALRLAGGSAGGAALLAGLEKAIEALLARLEGSPLLDAGSAADGPARLVGRLEAMRQLAALRTIENRPAGEQRAVARLWHAAVAVNRALFERALLSCLDRFEQLLADGGDDDTLEAALPPVEADARRLRVFMLAASRLEEGQEYDRLVEAAILRLAGRAAGDAGAGIARLRLIELLGGSARALRFLAAHHPVSR